MCKVTKTAKVVNCERDEGDFGVIEVGDVGVSELCSLCKLVCSKGPLGNV